MEVPECNVCHVALDEEDHQPRHLGCSHDACTACVKALIKNDSLECPLCRRVVKASTHEDFLINHGVCQVLRLFKGCNVSENKPKEEGATANIKEEGATANIKEEGATANIKEVCSIHECTADKRCASCKVWICIYCTEFHTTDIGCEIQEYSEFLMDAKKKHKEQVEPTLLSVRKNLRILSSELSDTESEKKKIEEKIENLQKAIREGTKTLNKFVAATGTVDKACTTMELNESVNISNGWHQFAQIWCKKNSGTSPNFLQKLKSGQSVFTSMEINGNRCLSKIFFENGNIFLQCFIVEGSNVIKTLNIILYEQLQTWLPAVRDLVSLDLAICGDLKGRVTIRLRQDLLSYAKNIPLLFTGEEGYSLRDLKFTNGGWANNLRMNVSSITQKMIKFTKDTNAGRTVVLGSVLVNWSGGILNNMYFYFEPGQAYDSSYDLIGQVETGLDTVKLCRKHNGQTEITVVDCGFVVKENLLRK